MIACRSICFLSPTSPINRWHPFNIFTLQLYTFANHTCTFRIKNHHASRGDVCQSGSGSHRELDRARIVRRQRLRLRVAAVLCRNTFILSCGGADENVACATPSPGQPQWIERNPGRHSSPACRIYNAISICYIVRDCARNSIQFRAPVYAYSIDALPSANAQTANRNRTNLTDCTIAARSSSFITRARYNTPDVEIINNTRIRGHGLHRARACARQT